VLLRSRVLHIHLCRSLNAKVEKMVEKMEISRVEKDKELKEELRALKDELHRQSQRQTDETERLKIETQHTTARLELEIGRQRRSLAKCMTKTKELRTLAKGWCERDLHVTSGAIWKWAVQMKKTPKEGKGKQLYTMEAQVYVTVSKHFFFLYFHCLLIFSTF
jgi:ATP-dependent Lon protease